jgi:hypothetical protein
VGIYRSSTNTSTTCLYHNCKIYINCKWFCLLDFMQRVQNSMCKATAPWWTLLPLSVADHWRGVAFAVATPLELSPEWWWCRPGSISFCWLFISNSGTVVRRRAPFSGICLPDVTHSHWVLRFTAGFSGGRKQLKKRGIKVGGCGFRSELTGRTSFYSKKSTWLAKLQFYDEDLENLTAVGWWAGRLLGLPAS